ncbi:hypothetical protein, partial [Acinetobacter indicus]|uniref:hypothetical protein n=1 Tax=Acinetobacter indicus TaxID=756892 RepID=UPI001443B3A5
PIPEDIIVEPLENPPIPIGVENLEPATPEVATTGIISYSGPSLLEASNASRSEVYSFFNPFILWKFCILISVHILGDGFFWI